jgi:hypothetical protein
VRLDVRLGCAGVLEKRAVRTVERARCTWPRHRRPRPGRTSPAGSPPGGARRPRARSDARVAGRSRHRADDGVAGEGAMRHTGFRCRSLSYGGYFHSPAGGGRRVSGLPLIGFAAVNDAKDEDGLGSVVHFEENPVIAEPHPPAIDGATQLGDTWGARVSFKREEGLHRFPAATHGGVWETPPQPSRRRPELDQWHLADIGGAFPSPHERPGCGGTARNPRRTGLPLRRLPAPLERIGEDASTYDPVRPWPSLLLRDRKGKLARASDRSIRGTGPPVYRCFVRGDRD